MTEHRKRRSPGHALSLALWCLGVGSLALGAPTEGAAQSVAGHVTEAGSGQPVVGSLVRIQNEATANLGMTLTDAEGRYQLLAPGAGRYVLVIERIGYGTTTLEAIDVPASGVVVLDASVETRAVILDGMRVDGDERRCELVADAAVQVQRLWTEAQKALEVAAWTERQRALRFRIRSREATLDARNLSVEDEQHAVRTETGGNTVRSLPAEELARDGYAQSGDDGSVDFYAPDATALMSDEFLATHCLGLAEESSAEPHLVGLRFSPVPGRRTPDIEGMLWMARASGRLDRLDFTYTNLPAAPGTSPATGSIRFAELSDGRWIVKDWYIRAPIVRVVRSSGLNGAVRRAMTTGFAERGSEVLSASGQGVDWVADRPAGAVEGMVLDSLSGQPLVGAEVRLAGRSWRTVTRTEGHFRFDDIPPGLFRVEFSHARLDSLGVDPGWKEVEVLAGEVARIDLAVPSRASIVAATCVPEEGAVIVGRVLEEGSSAPVPGASVSGVGIETATGQPLETRTEPDGWYRLCAVPGGAAVTLVARLGTLASATTEVEPPSEGRLNTDFHLDLSRPSFDARTREPLQTQLTGTVVNAESSEALSNVVVQLRDAAGAIAGQALTDSRGRFSLRPITEGAFSIEAEAPGYTAIRGAALGVRAGRNEIEVRLAPEAIPVEGVVVEVEARTQHLERNGFYERRDFSGGQFIDIEDIQALAPTRATDVLLRVPGIQPVSFPGENGDTTLRRIQLRGAVRFAVEQRCLPGVYIDGALAAPPLVAGTGEDLAMSPPIDNLVSWQDIEAIEIYDTPATTPVRFQAPGPPCGVLVIWTRFGGGER